MNKRKFKKISEEQRVFEMPEFFERYYQYDINHINVGISMEDSIREILAFRTFMEDTDFIEKTHHSLLIYRTKMEKLLNQSEDPEYYHFIKVWVKKYQEELKHALEKRKEYRSKLHELNKEMDTLNKQKSFYQGLSKDTQSHLTKLREKKTKESFEEFIEKDKQLLTSITLSLNELVEKRKSLKKKLDCLLHQQDLNEVQIDIIKRNKKSFESRLYALEHKDIIRNIINNIYPLEIEEVDRNMVLTGLAVLVRDKEGVVLPYANPYCLEQVEWFYHNMLGEDIREILWEDSPKKKVLKREEDK